MDSKKLNIDWALLQSFVAVSEYGSLSEAARQSGGSQPTLSRHIAILERKLGVRLFDRAIGGTSLTPAGLELMEHARDMADAAGRVMLTIEGRTRTLSGTVRITASEIVAAYVLPEILTALHIEEPDLEIELVASNETDNLLRREADIAVRMYRPTQLDVFTRKVGEFQIGMFAAQTYIARKGIPKSINDLRDHDLIGYDKDDQIIEGLRAAGLDVGRDFFSFRCDNQIIHWRMVLAGFGLGFNQLKIGEAATGVKRVEVAGVVEQLPIWLTAHSELKSSARVRRVYDALAEGLTGYCV